MPMTIGANCATYPDTLIIHFKCHNWNAVFKLQTALVNAIQKTGIGHYDGSAMSLEGSDGTMYPFAADALELMAFVAPLLRAAPYLYPSKVSLHTAPRRAHAAS